MHQIGPTNPGAFDSFTDGVTQLREEFEKFLENLDDEGLGEAPLKGTPTGETICEVFDPKISALRRRMPTWLAQGFGCSLVAADYTYWLSLRRYSFAEAVSLSLGVEPHNLPENIQSSAAKQNDPAKTNTAMYFLGQRVRMLRGYTEVGWDGPVGFDPLQLLRLVQDVGLQMPAVFVEGLEKRYPPKEPKPLQSVTSMSSLERQSLLKLVAAMACEQYAFDPNAPRSDTVSRLSDDLDAVGLGMDAKTIRKWLKEAVSLVDSNYWES
jgi:hypothetical protein